MAIKSLIINPGSTSTKIGVFEDETLLFEETLRHTTEEISQFAMIVDQKDFRKKIITDLLASKNFDMKSLNMVVGRGGMGVRLVRLTEGAKLVSISVAESEPEDGQEEGTAAQ